MYSIAYYVYCNILIKLLNKIVYEISDSFFKRMVHCDFYFLQRILYNAIKNFDLENLYQNHFYDNNFL